MTLTIDLTTSENKNYLPSSQEMALFDKATIEAGTPGVELMERAGKAMFEVIKQRYFNRPEKIENITVLVGPGNNGGDALVVARLLHAYGRTPQVVVAQAERYSQDHLAQAKEYLKQGGSISFVGNALDYEFKEKAQILNEQQLAQILQKSVLVIDGFFGTGQKKAPTGQAAKLLEAVAEKAKDSIRVALDLPSGINASTGEIYAPCFSADLTITIELVKRGMLQYPARAACGQIITVAIGIDSSDGCEFSLFDKSRFKNTLQRASQAHKGDFGHVLVIGGSFNYQGAPILAAQAALRAGAGLVTLASKPTNKQVAVPSEIMHLHSSAKSEQFSKQDLSQISKILDQVSCVVLGPGLGQAKSTASFFLNIIKKLIEQEVPVVLDADGLNLLAKSHKKFTSALKHFILTPHPGEMARLLNCSVFEVQADRYSAVKKLSQKYKCTAVLKGAASISYSSDRGVVNLSGNPYMASAGSGDVLSGVIAALVAQGLDLFEASSLGVYLHGLAGDINLRKRKAPIVAGDLIKKISDAISSL